MDNRQEYIVRKMKELASVILPTGAELWLYGSQARGDNHPDSDWDLLILLDKNKADRRDYDTYAFPFCMLGAELDENFSPLVYGKNQWLQFSASPFSQNVVKDKIVLQ